jgi:biofilm protein TabA
MILDNLTQWRQYVALSPRFEKAFDFLDHFDGQTKLGRNEIDGDNVYALVQRYTTKPAEEGKFEAHRKYIDVQYLHTGRETILWAPLSSLTKVIMPYDASGDAALFGHPPESLPLHLGTGQFTILFPEDGHVPGCVWEKPCEVFKVVVKVRVNEAA